jgi:hypothetical protein
MEVRYPSNPTGTSPSVIADIYHADTSGGTYTFLTRVHDVDATTTGYPKLRRRQFATRKPYVKIRWTLPNSDNNFGTAEVAVSLGMSRGHKEV